MARAKGILKPVQKPAQSTPTRLRRRGIEKPDVLLPRVSEIVKRLRREYPEAHCSLNFETPFQLLIATILSAQCTDQRVNKVTPELFRLFPDANAMARAGIPELERHIASAGFFRMKAKSILATSQSLVALHGGNVPKDLESLTALRGVGRKTANVVLGNAYGIPGMVVDTHVGRISRRLGLTIQTDPVKVEQDLEVCVARSDWVDFSHLLIFHGRAICTARRAKCEECFLSPLCEKRI